MNSFLACTTDASLMKCIKIVEVHKVLCAFFVWNVPVTPIPARGMLGVAGLTIYAGHPGQHSRCSFSITLHIFFIVKQIDTCWL